MMEAAIVGIIISHWCLCPCLGSGIIVTVAAMPMVSCAVAETIVPAAMNIAINYPVDSIFAFFLSILCSDALSLDPAVLQQWAAEELAWRMRLRSPAGG